MKKNCDFCRYLLDKNCKHPYNIIIINEKIQYKEKPEVINCNNDCAFYKQK